MQNIVTKECKHHGLTFYTYENGHGYRCIKCKSRNVTQWRKDKKIKLINLFGGECEICGYKKCIRALHFHHLDPSVKEFNISSGDTVSFVKVLEEVKKCILVCSNCHAEIEDGIIQVPQDLLVKRLGQNFDIGKISKPTIVREKSTISSGTLYVEEDGIISLLEKFPKKIPHLLGKKAPRPECRKIERPCKDILEYMLWKMPTTKIAQIYGVSDKAVEKWAKLYNLIKPPRGYWQKIKYS